MVQLLIKERNARSIDDLEALLAAISREHLDIAHASLDSGIDPNTMGFLTTPLKEAILDGHISFARYLIGRDVDFNARGNERSHGRVQYLTPLQAVVDTCLEDIVEILLIKGANPNDEPGRKPSRRLVRIIDSCHGTALVLATRLGNIHIILALLDHGANLDCCRPITPPQIAIEAENLPVARLLLDKDANVCAGSNGRTV